MKKLGRRSKSIISLLLTVILLLGSVFPTVVYAQGADLAYEALPSSTDETLSGEQGGLDTGWCEIDYDKNGITVTLHPEKDALLGINAQQLKDLLATVKEAFKNILVEQMKDNWAADNSTEPPDGDSSAWEGMTIDKLWSVALDSYVESEYGGEGQSHYLDFFDDVMHKSESVDELVDYICDAIRLAVMAGMPTEDLPEADAALRAHVEEALDKFMIQYMEDTVDAEIEEYVNSIGAFDTNTESKTKLETFIEAHITDYLHAVITNYIDHKITPDINHEDHVLNSYIDKYIIDNNIQDEQLVELKNNQDILKNVTVEIIKNTSDSDKQTVISLIAQDEELVGDAIHELFNLGSNSAEADAIFRAKVNEIILKIVDNYEITREELIAEPPSFDFKELIKALISISVNDLVLYDGTINKSNIIELIKTLPTLEDIETMAPEEMKLEYKIGVSTTLGNIEFTLKAQMAADCPDCDERVYEKINTLAKIIRDHIDLSYSGGKLTVNVRLPEIFADAVLKACNTNKISDSLKQKVFALFDQSIDDAYLFYQGLTFDEIITLLKNINFEKILSNGKVESILQSDFINKYFDASQFAGMSNEEVIAKLEEYEALFNKINSKAAAYLEKIYNYIPDAYKDMTFADSGIYEGTENGNSYFGIEKTFTVTDEMLSKLEIKLREQFPEKEAEIIYILGLLDLQGFSSAIDLNVTVPDVAKITYKVGDEEIREGFLPEGATIADFAGITSYGGKSILFWIDEAGNKLIKMPAKETTVTAVLDMSASVVIKDAAGNVLDSISAEYDPGKEYTLEAALDTELGSVSYQWYYLKALDAAPIELGTTKNLTVSGAGHSGFYYCQLTVSVGGESIQRETEKRGVDISKIEIFASQIFDLSIFDKKDENIFVVVENGSSYSVINSEYAELFNIVNDYMAQPGTYTTVATLKDSDNYILLGGWNSAQLTWHIIEKISASVDKDSISFTYDSNEQTSTVAVGAVSGATVEYKWYKSENGVWTLISDKTNNILTVKNVSDSGEYKCEVILTKHSYSQTKDVFVTVAVSPREIDVNSLSSTVGSLVYNGTLQSHPVAITLPDNVKVEYTGDVSVKKPGDYTVTAAISFITPDSNYTIVNASRAFAFSVAKAEFDYSKISWGELGPFTYVEGTTYTVALEGYEEFTFGDVIAVYADDSVNEAENVGKYVAKFSSFRVIDGDSNYPLTEYYTEKNQDAEHIGFRPSVEWEIKAQDTPTPPDQPKTEHDFNEGGIHVNVKDPAGLLSDYSMYITRADIGEIITLPSGKKFRVLEAYNIIFRDQNGNAPTFDGTKTFNVTFDIPSGADLDKLEIIFVAETDTNHELITSLISSDSLNVSFDVNHFSIYAMAEEIEDTPVVPPDDPTPPIDPDEPTTPDTPEQPAKVDPIIVIIFIALLLLIVFLVLIAFTTKKRRKHRIFIPEFDESIELYEDLEELSEKESSTVFVDADMEPPIFIDYDAFSSTSDEYPSVVISERPADNLITLSSEYAQNKPFVSIRESKEKALGGHGDIYVEEISTEQQGISISGVITETPLPDKQRRIKPVTLPIDDEEPVNEVVEIVEQPVIAPVQPQQPIAPKAEHVFDKNGVYVKVIDEAGYLKDTDMSVSLPKSKGQITLPDGKKLRTVKAYDISFKNEKGKAPRYDGSNIFEVTFKLPENIETENLKIAGADVKGKSFELLPSSVSWNRKFITFGTTHFSVYAIVEEEEMAPIAEPVLTENIEEIIKPLAIKLDEEPVLFDEPKENEAVTGLECQPVTEEIPVAEPIEEAYFEEEIPVAEPIEEAYFEEEIPVAEPIEEAPFEEEIPVAEPIEEAPFEEEIPVAEPIEEDSAREEILWEDEIQASSDSIAAPLVAAIPLAISKEEEKQIEAPIHIPVRISDDGNTIIIHSSSLVAEAPIVKKSKQTPTHDGKHPISDKPGASKHTELAVPEAPIAPIVFITDKEQKEEKVTLEVAEPITLEQVTEAPLTKTERIAEPTEESLSVSEEEADVTIFVGDTLDAPTREVIKLTAAVSVRVTRERKEEELPQYQSRIIITDDDIESAELPIAEDNADDEALNELTALIEEPIEQAPIEEELSAEELIEDDQIEEELIEEPTEEASLEESFEEVIPQAELIEEPQAIDEPESNYLMEAPILEIPEQEEDEAPETVEEAVEEQESEIIEEVIEGPIVLTASGDGDGDGTMLINGQIITVRYRSSFTSRLIQASETLQDYYTQIKNVLLSYKSVKARMSWNLESFNKGRIQCAKVNVKGKTLVVYLALNPGEYVDTKYHFKDMSHKPKFAKVPMMLKIRSARALKYAIELIRDMMSKLGIPMGSLQEADYRMPYETTEALVARNLVKLILPKGMSIDENTNVVKMDVSQLIATSKTESSESEVPIEEPTEEVVEEAPIEEPTEEVVEEAPIEEPAQEVIEEAPIEEPTEEVVEEAPIEEPAQEVIEEAPIEEPTEEVIEEAPIEEPTEEVVEEAPIEEPAQEVIEEAPIEEPTEVILHVDAIKADELVSDEEAEKRIEIIAPESGKHTGKMCEINLDTICENFEDGETVTLQALKKKRLINNNAGRLKVLARGVMTKNLIIIADKFSLQAVKMITLAGGHAEQLK